MDKSRLRKYYEAGKANKPLLKTSLSQKSKILLNILRFFSSNYNKLLIIKNKPVAAQIEPTSLCNLKCEICIREKIGVPIGTMKFEDFKKILDKLDCLFKIHLSGQGEPFLNPDIFKMIRYANKRGILVNTTSNGSVLTKKIIDEICRVDIGNISISLDSANKEIYEKIRRGANFEKVIENIKHLTSELKKRKRRTIVSSAIVILKENFEEIPDFVKLAYKVGIKKLIFQTIQNKKDYVDKYDKKIKKQMVVDSTEKIKKEIEKVKELGREYKIHVIFDEGKAMGGCIWPWRGIYITWNGYVTPCCTILDYRRPLMGNILEEDFWRIWNGRNYQMFRKYLRERKAPIPCRGCRMV